LHDRTEEGEDPLLVFVLDNLKASQNAAILNLKDSVGRIYALNKWLLGAMAVAL
jgi:hypothetical protein